MNGLLVINKHAGVTSHDIVNDIRRTFNTKQVGHLGTLDPLATGVLVVCIGEATKLVQYLESVSKEYVCEALIGMESDSYDRAGTIIDTKKVTCDELNEELVDKCLLSFLGKSKQLPPIYSAIKVGGKKLYEYARKGKEVEVPSRDIEIYEIERVSDLSFHDDVCTFKFRVVVSKGTYIRSICHDLGEKLGFPCLMNALERTRNGIFKVEESSSIEDIKLGKYSLVNMIDATSDIPFVSGDDFIKKARNGMKISPIEVKKVLRFNPEMIRIIDNDKLVGIYLFDKEVFCYKAGRVWN